MFTSGLGLLILLLGAAVWADLQPIYWILEAIKIALAQLTRVLPRSITGPLVLLIGGGLIWLGQSRSFGSIQQALAPEKDTVLVDALLAQRRLNRGPAIVAIGGGTGLSTLLVLHFGQKMTQQQIGFATSMQTAVDNHDFHGAGPPGQT